MINDQRAIQNHKCFLKKCQKIIEGFVHPKMEVVSFVARPHVVLHPWGLCLSSEHRLGCFNRGVRYTFYTSLWVFLHNQKPCIFPSYNILLSMWASSKKKYNAHFMLNKWWQNFELWEFWFSELFVPFNLLKLVYLRIKWWPLSDNSWVINVFHLSY